MKSPEQNDSGVRLSEETITLMRQHMAQAVRDGIMDSLTEEAAEIFWRSGINMLQKNAAEQTGRWVAGGLWSVARKAGVFLLLGGLLYSVGGWAALSALAKTLFGPGH
jgi:hypothetical protein